MGSQGRQRLLAAITMGLLLAGSPGAAAGRSRRSPHRKPPRPPHVLSQTEIDAYLEAEEMKSRAAQRNREAHTAAAPAAHILEAADLSSSLLAGGLVAPPGPGEHVHRAIMRRSPGAPPPTVSGEDPVWNRR